jgi:hypothetical protein
MSITSGDTPADPQRRVVTAPAVHPERVEMEVQV